MARIFATSPLWSGATVSKRFWRGRAAPKLDLSPLVPFETFADLAAARADPVAAGAGGDAEAVEGIC